MLPKMILWFFVREPCLLNKFNEILGGSGIFFYTKFLLFVFSGDILYDFFQKAFKLFGGYVDVGVCLIKAGNGLCPCSIIHQGKMF